MRGPSRTNVSVTGSAGHPQVPPGTQMAAVGRFSAQGHEKDGASSYEVQARHKRAYSPLATTSS